MNAEVKKSNRTEEILKVMHILAWVGFIGVAINGGAILITYIISCYNPEAAENLYKGLDLLALRKTSFWYYTQSVTFIIAQSTMRAWVFYSWSSQPCLR